MIHLAEATKEYGGGWGLPGRRVLALDRFSLDVPAGTALGIVGPNGAGKSTLIRLLLGYLHPSAGEITIGGIAPRSYAERHGVGYVPERVAIPPRWTARHALRAFAALGEVENGEMRIERELERWGLEEAADRRVGALSKGMLQRLALAQALLGERVLLILDEPTDGLDPEWIVRTREILRKWKGDNPERVLLFASHNLHEVERIADRVAVLEGGRLRETLEMRAPSLTLPAYRLEIEGNSERIGRLLRGVFPDADADPADPRLFRVRAPDLPELNRRIAGLIEQGVVVRALMPEHPSLEERFRRSAAVESLQ